MSRQLITVGAGGRVGKLLKKAAASNPSGMRHLWTSRNIDNNTSESSQWLLDDGGDGLSRLIEPTENKPVILLLAGVTSGSETELAVNGTLAHYCLTAAKRLGVRRVLLASSSSVYGRPQSRPFVEDANPCEPSPYGRAKLAMESIASPFRDNGMDVCCLRIGNVLGADALMLAAQRATVDEPLLLDRFSDGDGPRRSYIGPISLLRVIEKLATIDAPLPFLLNTAAPRPISMAALARAAKIPWLWQGASDASYQDVILSCARLQGLFKFSPQDSDPATILAQLSLVLDTKRYDSL